jgi:retinol dehydrogenase-12
MSRIYHGLKGSVMDLFPAKPSFTEKECPDLTGKVYIVTGGATGIGYYLTKFLVEKNAKVYVVARNQQKIDDAISKLRQEVSNANIGHFMCDFADLSTVKPAVDKFLKQEARLDGIVHNAGVMMPPHGSETKQGYEMQLGTNNVGPFLLQKFLDDIMILTAKSAPKNSTRIVWVSSSAHNYSPANGGIKWSDINYKEKPLIKIEPYGQSKAINFYTAVQWGKHYENSNVLSVCVHPGVLKSELTRHLNYFESFVMKLLSSDTIYGAYSEFFGLLSPEITEEHNGAFIQPFGVIGSPRPDIMEMAQGENGEAIWNWLEEQIKPYL